MPFVHTNLASWFLWDLYILYISLYFYLFILLCTYPQLVNMVLKPCSFLIHRRRRRRRRCISLSLSLSAWLPVRLSVCLPSSVASSSFFFSFGNRDKKLTIDLKKKKKDRNNNQGISQTYNLSRVNDDLLSACSRLSITEYLSGVRMAFRNQGYSVIKLIYRQRRWISQEI